MDRVNARGSDDSAKTRTQRSWGCSFDFHKAVELKLEITLW